MTAQAAKAVVLLDLEHADRLMLSYKRGLITLNALRRKLAQDAGLSESMLDRAILETQQTPIHELERRVADPDNKIVRVAYVQCTMCFGEKLIHTNNRQQPMKLCPRCQGAGVVVETVQPK